MDLDRRGTVIGDGEPVSPVEQGQSEGAQTVRWLFGPAEERERPGRTIGPRLMERLDPHPRCP